MGVKIKSILNKLNSLKIDYSFRGNNDDVIIGISSLKRYKQDTMTWCKSEQYYSLVSSNIALIIIGDESNCDCKNVIETSDPKRVFFTIAENFFQEPPMEAHIASDSFISDQVQLGNNVIIGHNCTLDGPIVIEDDTIIYNNVTIINSVTIGKKCIIQSGTVIGHDDLGYTEDENHNKHMIKHYGGVTIKDNVFIGAMCAINRGTIDDTMIDSGTKIDAMCHISHNVLIGKNCTLVSGSRLYGSVELGNNVYVASAIVENQVAIGDNTIVGMNSVVRRNVGENKKVVGTPAREIG